MSALRPTRSAIAAVIALTLTLLALLLLSSASADPPPSAAGTTSHGFLAKRGVLSPIDHPRATTIPATPDGQAGTATTGINDRGEVLGAYEGRDRVIRHFVRDRKGRFARLEDPPGGSDLDEYVDINNRGETVGFYNDAQGATTTGFLRTKRGRFVDVVVPGSVVSGPLKINDRRQVVGIYVDKAESVHGFLWDDGEFRTIDVPGATGTVVLGINNRGHMVGSYIDANGAYHGFLRKRNGRVLTLPDVPGAEPAMGGTQPVRINDRGLVVGLAYDAQGGSRAFLLERDARHAARRPRRRLHARARHQQPGRDHRGLWHPSACRFSGRSEVHPAELTAGHVQHLAVDVVGPGRAQEEDAAGGLLGGRRPAERDQHRRHLPHLLGDAELDLLALACSIVLPASLAAVRRVSTKPKATAFTLILNWPHSLASVFVRPTTPGLPDE